jgi:hypothetical protein
MNGMQKRMNLMRKFGKPSLAKWVNKVKLGLG